MSRPRPRRQRLALLLGILLATTPAPHDGHLPGSRTAPTRDVGPHPRDHVLPLGVTPPRPFDRSTLTTSGALLADFDPPAAPWSAGHRGVDLAGSEGASVRAPSDGVVTFAAVVVDRPVVVVAHPDGLRSTLEPVEPTVDIGSNVLQGTDVGLLGTAAASHCAPVACLHWGVLRGDDYLDPLALVGATETVVLLPLGSGTLAAGQLLPQASHRRGVHLGDP